MIKLEKVITRHFNIKNSPVNNTDTPKSTINFQKVISEI